ncbi:MAG: hypothetical protein U5K79_11870 [Cyclobacteriaceae bacterium]|nr:hypothetical protein [Cyclobacteriaceae bacterium]
MKIYTLRVSIALVATFLSFSCDDEFLERYPLDQVSSNSFWNTENDLLVYDNGI